ncbi:hypothetical protein PENTCL1PPCAC_6965, partial [Pristionchus entomophagus]
CGGRKKLSDRDPFPPSTIASPKGNLPESTPSLPDYDNWRGDQADQTTTNELSECLDNENSQWGKQKKGNRSTESPLDSNTTQTTQSVRRTGADQSERSNRNLSDTSNRDKIQKKGKSPIKTKAEEEHSKWIRGLNQSGARYGSMSGGPHRQYLSLDEIKGIEETIGTVPA